MIQQFLNFLAGLFNRESKIVAMSLQLVQAMGQRLEAVEQRLDVLTHEVDDYRSKWLKDQATIAELQRRLDASDRKIKDDEFTIIELKRRISELEDKQNAG